MRRTAIAVMCIALVAPRANAQQGRDDVSFGWSKQLPAGSTITIRNGRGPIHMREVTGDRVEVRATKLARSRNSIRTVAFDVRESDTGASVCTLYGRETSCRDERTSGLSSVVVEFTVLVPSGMSADMTTGNGGIDVRLTSNPSDGVLRFGSGSGTLRIGLPQDFNGRLDTQTGKGTLRSDFELQVIGRLDAHHLTATIGHPTLEHGHGPLLQLRTGKGDVELRRN